MARRGTRRDRHQQKAAGTGTAETSTETITETIAGKQPIAENSQPQRLPTHYRTTADNWETGTGRLQRLGKSRVS